MSNQNLESGKVLAWFTATWCGPCKQLARVVAPIESKLDCPVIKIDVDEQPEVAEEFGILSVPTLLVLRDGAVAGTVSARRALPLIEEVNSL